MRIAPAGSDDFLESRMFNFSRSGLYMETNQVFPPDSKIVIVMNNYAPAQYGPEAYRSYIARICWGREREDRYGIWFGAGVQFQSKSHEMIGETKPDILETCDLCGALSKSGEYHRLQNEIILCLQCYTHFSKFPEGEIKQCIERFILGNVL